MDVVTKKGSKDTSKGSVSIVSVAKTKESFFIS
jgi:hypothetical protein